VASPKMYLEIDKADGKLKTGDGFLSINMLNIRNILMIDKKS